MSSRRSSRSTINVNGQVELTQGEETSGKLLFQPDVFWDYCRPARLASTLDARLIGSGLKGLPEAEAACVVTVSGSFDRNSGFVKELFRVEMSSSKWYSHGTLARGMADACSKILQESATYRGVNTLHVLSAHLILKLLPFLNFLHTFEAWTQKNQGAKSILVAGPSLVQTLQPLAAKRMPDLRVKELPVGERIHRWCARFHQPLLGWHRWSRTRGPVNPDCDGPDVLFTASRGSPLKIVRAVVEHLVKDSPRLAVVAVDRPCSAKLSASLYNAELGRPFPQHRIDRAIVDQLAERETHLREVFTYQGVSLWPIIEPHLVAVVKTMVPVVAQAVDGLNELFTKLNPRVLVVSNNSVWSDRVAILVAQKFGIRSLAIQDGDYQNTWPWEILSDKIAVQGEQSARVLEAYGTPRGRIETTGQVRYDHLNLQGADRTKQALRVKLDIETNYLAVVATDPGSLTHSPLDKQNNESYAIRELSRLANWSLIMKLHPQDNGSITRSLVRNRPEIRVISDEFNAEELIVACDLWVSTASTTGVEAVICGRPVALLNRDGGNFMPELAEAGVATYVRDDGELEAVARNIAGHNGTNDGLAESREAFLRDRLYKLDGKSTARVAALIQEMM